LNYINEYDHLLFLRQELAPLLTNGSFAARMQQSIGYELHYRLVDYIDQDEVEFSSLYPAQHLRTASGF
jgi:hypothetical protein